jgi:hypothetical protein
MLLDGLFLAVRTQAIKEAGLRFDERFRFHCYDLDFCRSALQRRLRIGTWPIAVTHDSGGAFGSAAFKEGARAYLDKWRVVEAQAPATQVVESGTTLRSPVSEPQPAAEVSNA